MKIKLSREVEGGAVESILLDFWSAKAQEGTWVGAASVDEASLLASLTGTAYDASLFEDPNSIEIGVVKVKSLQVNEERTLLTVKLEE